MVSGAAGVEYSPTLAFSSVKIHLRICNLCLFKAMNQRMLLLLFHVQPQSIWKHLTSHKYS